MRKQIIDQNTDGLSAKDSVWLNLEQLAYVELTSEDKAYPIEAALRAHEQTGWKALQSGRQTIRFIFDEPQKVRRIQLRFEEKQQTRTQEFVLRWSSDGGQSYQIVRQQYNFSPGHTTSELEDFTVDLAGVSAIELCIIPDIEKGNARASLSQFRMA